MVKFLHFKTMALLLLMIVGASSAWADTAVLPNTQALTTSFANVGNDANIQIKTSSANTYTNPLRIYANTTVTIQAVNGCTIQSVAYVASSTGNYVTYAQNATVSPSVTPTVSNTSVTWTFSDNVTEFTFKPSSQTRCNSITITYVSSKANADLSYGENTSLDVNLTQASAFVAPTLSNPHSLAVTYASSNTNVVSVDQSTGEATITGAGNATVTASFAGNESYKEGSASYTVNVNDDRAEAVLTWSEAEINISQNATEQDYASLLPTLTKNPATLEVSYSSSNEDVVLYDGSDWVIETSAIGSSTITATFAGNAQYKPATASVTINVRKAIPSGALFYESFDQCAGTGGNDGSWNGSIASNTLIADNDGWNFSNEGGAAQCAKLGTGSKKGSAQTPLLPLDAGTYKLKFTAAAWNGSSEGTTLVLNAENASLSSTEISLTKAQFNDFEVTLTVIEPQASVHITFEGKNNSNNRFFLDEILLTDATPATVQKEVKSAGWATWVPAINVEVPTGVKAYIVSGTTSTNATLTQVTSIPAGTPVLLNTAGTHTFSRCNYSNLANVTNNKLEVVGANETITSAYVLANYNDEVAFYKYEGAGLDAGQVYLPVPANGTRMLSFSFDEATGVNAVNGDGFMVNGPVYDLQGRRVAQPQKGLYIVNGRKVVIK